MIVLAVFGGVGILWLLAGALSWGAGSGEPFPFQAVGTVVVGVLFLGLVAAGFAWVRTRSNPAAFGIGRVIVETLSLAGALMLIVVLLGVGAFVFLLVVCAMSGGPGFGH
jgi:hypothetical protein